MANKVTAVTPIYFNRLFKILSPEIFYLQ